MKSARVELAEANAFVTKVHDRDTAWGCASRPRDLKGQGLGQKVRWLWLTGIDE